jgi:hypothetical protein
MMIIPASSLSESDLTLLGNNLLPPDRPRRTRPRSHLVSANGDDDLDAVNRSLARHGEIVARLYRGTPFVGTADHRAQPAA